MSRTIDEKVVSMQFDNRNFESNVKTTMSTVENLNKSLQFNNAGKGLEGINTAISRCNFSPLTNGIDAVGIKFNALYTIADQTLRNITNSAYNTGKRLLSALTIDPVKTGFSEYETQINSVQTILANTESKGTTLTDVNAALDELNEYADKTIYNFTEMTRNIGTFTAAGVELDTAVNSIQGIANLAAVSGSTSQQASTAMYQLSQALAAGKVSLMDWNSVVNAGMGGEVFQNALKRTSEVLGTGAEAAIKKYGTFRESLSKGQWLTTEVLTETLNQISGAYSEADLIAKGYTKEQAAEIAKLAKTATDAATKVKTATQLWDTLKEAAQSGWTQTWEILVGDFGEAKELWTTVSDTVGAMIGESANKRNTLLSGALDTNWEKFIKSVNDAGIETEEFEDKLKKLAESKGIDLTALIEKHGSLEKVFRSGAASSNLLREAVKGVDGVSTNLIGTIGKLGGRELIIESLVNIFKTLKMVISPAKAAIDEIFTVDPKGLYKSIQGFHELTGNVKDFFSGALDSNWDRFIKSVNDAGMETEDFEAKVAALAKEKGINLDGLIKKYGSFEKVFRAGSGSSSLLRESISDLNGVSVDLIKNFNKLSGKELIFESIINVFDGLKSVISPIKEAFAEIFDIKINLQSSQLYALIEGIHSLTEKLKLSETQSEQLKTTFKGLFSVIRMGIDFISAIATGVWGLIGSFNELGIVGSIGDKLLEFGSSVGNYLINLRSSAKETDIFGTAVNKVVGIIQSIIKYIKELAGAIKIRFDMLGFEGFSSVLTSVWNIVTRVGAALGEAGRNIAQAFLNIFRTGDLAAGFDILNSGLLATILLGVKKFVGSLTETLDVKGGFIESLKSLRDGLLDTFGSVQDKLKSETLMSLAKAIALLTVSVLVLALIDPGKLTASLAAMAGLFYELSIAMKTMTSIVPGAKVKTLMQMTSMMIAMSASILILAAAMKVIATMSWGELVKGLVGVMGLTTILVAAGTMMSKGSKKVIKGASQMVIMAAALLILTSVCKKMGDLNWTQLAKGIVGIGSILLEFAGFQMIMSSIKPKKLLASATSLVIIGAAMEIFADVTKKFGDAKWEELGKAGAAIGGILLLAAGFALLSGLSKKIGGSAVALVIIGASMEIFSDVCHKFGELKWEELGKAGAAIGGILLLAAGFALLSGLSSKMFGSVVSLTIISAAMEIFADVCQKFSTMKWEELGKAGAAIGGILLLAAGFALLSGLASGMLASSAALLIMASSLSILTPVLTTLGSMTIGEIAKSLILIAGAFAIMGVAGLTLAPLVPSIIGLSAALALLGVACAAVGAGVWLFSTGLAALATAGAAGATAFVAAIGVIITGLLALVPTIIQLLGDMFVAFGLAVVEAAPALGAAFKTVFLTLVDILVECTPALANGALQLLIGVMTALVEYGPQLIDLLFDFLISVLDGLAERIPELVQSAVNLVASFFASVIEALKAIDTTTLINAIAGVGLISAFILAIGLITPLIPSAMLGILGIGAIIAEMAIVLAAIGALAQIPGLEWLVNESGDFLQAIGNAIGGFIGGIVGGALEGITSSLPQVASDLSLFMQNLAPFIDGAKTIDSTMLEGVEAIAGIILTLTKTSIIDGLTSWLTGGSSLAGFAEQLVPFGEAMSAFSQTVSGKIDAAAITAAANAGKIIAEMATTLPNTGGVVSLFTGDNSMSDFFEQLVPFGEAIVAFSTTVAGKVDEAAVTAAANSGKVIAEMAKTLPNSGGVAGWFSGENDVSTFAEQLVPFGEAIASFSKTVTGRVDEGAVAAAANAGKLVAEMAAALPNTGGVAGWFAGNNDMGNFGDQLVSFGNAMSEFAESISFSTSVNISLAVAQVNQLLSLIRGMSGIDFGVVNAFDKSLANIGKRGITAFTDAFENSNTKVNAAAKSMMNYFVTAIKGSTITVSNAAKVLAKKIVASLKTGYSGIYSAGSYLAQGFADGISANSYKAEAKARAMAQAAVTAAKEALAINSPSKIFMRIGNAIPEGFAMGIDKCGSIVQSSSASMANVAIAETRSAIAKVSDFLSMDIETEPTIRPILDLSNVKSGANRINNLFGVQPSLELLTNVGSISTRMNDRQNEVRTSNEDVVTAIKDLQTAIRESSGDTYTINGITYDDGSTVANAMKAIVRSAVLQERR